MDLDTLYTTLKASGLPVTYRAWNPPDNPAPPLPWICYLQTTNRPFAADGVAYYSGQQYRVELYTAEKDPVSEQAVEAALTAAGIFYTKEETYLDSESCYEIIYEIEV